MTRPRATQRRGVSLIEMLVVISIGTVVMGAVVTGTAALLRVNQRVHARADAGAQVDRLATRLRADLRQASQASWDPGTGTLSLVQADSSEIAYSCEGGRCLRTHGDAVLPFRLPTDTTLHCPADAASEPGRFQVTVRLGEFRRLPVAVHLGSGRRLLSEGGSP